MPQCFAKSPGKGGKFPKYIKLGIRNRVIKCKGGILPHLLTMSKNVNIMLRKTRFRFSKLLTGQYPVSESMFEEVII